MNDIAEKISRFTETFEQQILIISSLSSENEKRLLLHKKILFVSLIDALSRVVFPRAGNRERFIAYIPDLVLDKRKQSEPATFIPITFSHTWARIERLRAHVRNCMRSETDEIIPLQRDPDMMKLESYGRLKRYRKPLEGSA